jgi:hypothetical protein
MFDVFGNVLDHEAALSDVVVQLREELTILKEVLRLA